MAQEKKFDQGNTDPNQQQTTNQPQALAGSSQSGTPSSGRVAGFSSGGTQAAGQPQGSGRFTNLQKYISANQGASQNMGARANQVVNRDFNKSQSEVNKQNEQIAQGFQQGRQALQQGQGFQQNLQDINTGLNTGYTDFGNRQGFDAAAEQAQQLAQNQDYANVASGQGFDQSLVGQQQAQALAASQGLLQNTQDRLTGLQTEQGRDQLFSQVLQPKQGYSAGQRNFDKLFLGGSLPSIQQNLQGKSTLANQILQGTQGQQGTLDELTSGESELLKNLSGQATTNQQTFFNKLYNPENVDFVKTARNTEYDNLVKALTSGGTLTQDQANLLGLSAQNSSGMSSGPISSKVGVEGSTPTAPQNYDVRTLNLLKDPANINKYLQRGGDPQSIQDLVMQGDLNNYNALTGLIYNNGKQATQNQLTGTSTMGSIFQPGSSGETLGQAVANANKRFNQDVTDKKYDVNQTGRWADVSLSGQQGIDLINSLTPEQRQAIQNYNPMQPGGTYQLYNQVADVLNQVPLSVKAFGNDANNINSDAGGANYRMRAEAIQALMNQMNNVGYGNDLTINNTAQVNPYQRFKGLL